MPVEAPVKKDNPVLEAFEQYQETEAYQNTRRWALTEEHVEGSLWAAFLEGWTRREETENPEADT